MSGKQFDKLQRLLYTALDAAGASYEVLELGAQPNNFYLKVLVDLDGEQGIYELTEFCDLEEESDECSCGGCCKELTEAQTRINREHVRY
jgi:hypothetical protein